MTSWFRDQVRQGMNVRSYVLLAVLVGMLAWIHSLDVKERELRARRYPALAAVPAPAVAAPRAPKNAAASLTPPGWGADPFATRVMEDAGEDTGKGAAVRPKKQPGTGLYLQGIMDGPLGRTALINGEIVREGQRVGSREVIQIGQKTVMLLDHGTVTTLTLKGDGS